MKKVFRVFGIFFLIFLIIIISGCSFVYSKEKNKLTESIQKGYNIANNISRKDFNTRQATNIYDKNGKLIKTFKTVDYIYKAYDEINQEVFNATIAIEDARFYSHQGVDFKSLLRAGYSTVIKKQTQGGSTITQQLVKNVYLTMEQSIWRKVTEAVIAQEMEEKFSKEDILEFYVNNINYGNGCYSIESAANYYYSKSTKDLTLAEIALLVGIPNNPTKYNPVYNFENAENRKNVILKCMYEQGMITGIKYNEEKEREIKLEINEDEINNSVTDYAQTYAIHESVEFIMGYYGFQFQYNFDTEKERKLYWEEYNEMYQKYYSELLSGGYDIYTSIDTKIQKKLQKIVNSEMSIYTDKNKKTKLYNKQCAATVIDNETGLVIGIVGGRTQKNVQNTYNRAFLSARQPGSTIKPIIVYTPAMELGYNANSILVDSPIKNGPKNATGAYSGNVKLRKAVQWSLNTTAYKLTQEIGIKKSVKYLENMNFKYLSSADNSSKSIGIGGFTYGVTTVEMASAYSTLARNGTYIEATNITKIYDRKADTNIYDNTYSKKRIYDDGAAYLMTDVLKSVMTGGTGTRYKLSNMKEQAGKTGTTNDGKDLWFCGYTPSYSMAVWVGNDTPSHQNELSAQGNIWNTMMTELNKDKTKEKFTVPDSVYKENGVLKYKKETISSPLLKIKEKEKERLAAEKNYLNSLSIPLARDYKNDIAEAYIYKLNSLEINSSEQFAQAEELITNSEEFMKQISDKNIISRYNESRDNLRNKIENKKQEYEQDVIDDQNKQKDEIWNEILKKYYNELLDKKQKLEENQEENVEESEEDITNDGEDT